MIVLPLLILMMPFFLTMIELTSREIKRKGRKNRFGDGLDAVSTSTELVEFWPKGYQPLLTMDQVIKQHHKLGQYSMAVRSFCLQWFAILLISPSK